MVSIKNGSDQEQENEAQPDAASSPSSVELPESAHRCPACPKILASCRELTTHLRGHNSPRSTDCSEEDFCCGICHKSLSSASSLDRHILVHSGERPFKCKYCEMAFTTNGNMNRHLRTHRGGTSSSLNSCTDSESSSDSEKSAKRKDLGEYNNNNITQRDSPDMLEKSDRSVSMPTKRRCTEYLSDEGQKKHRIMMDNSRTEVSSPIQDIHNVHICPVCGKQDFTTDALLEAHLESSHPKYPAKCEACNLSFKNHRVLNLHRFMIHFADHSIAGSAKSLKSSIVGFHDLTFIDFSSDKFPAIARAVCEQSLHRPASGEATRFQCAKCLRAFPCRSALDAHEIDCGTPNSQNRMTDDSQSRRDNFFAGLDLQNKAALAEAKEGKDLADIQSIISVTSGPILQNFPQTDASSTDSNIKYNTSVNSSSSSSGIFSLEYHEEEAQDAFAAEFRKMKLKGEFPCRLCSAIFPNLRALKGHNRAHMGVGPGMPYPCNMCPYTSTDKATLVRHLRSHNGDRPYECSLCNYAFTTKANCERHVRNRHGKLTREDIKSVLIYHPNEDSTNDTVDRSSPRVMKDDARKSLTYTNERTEFQHQVQVHYPTTSMGDIRIIEEAKLHSPNNFDKSNQPIELTLQRMEECKSAHDSSKSDYSKLDEELESSGSSDVNIPLVNKIERDQRIQASPMNLKKGPDEAGPSDDGPLDLSMDVLDLSKKSRDREENNSSVEQRPEQPQTTYYNASQLLLTEALLKAGQGTSKQAVVEALYKSSFYQNIGTIAAGVGANVLSPYMFNPQLFAQDIAMKERLQKELVRGLQLTSGGTMVEPPTSGPSGYNSYPQGQEPDCALANEQKEYVKLMAAKMASKIVSNKVITKPANIPSAHSVKMVIKNGILMPKQKQRRYRTERPFTCEHCGAKFTLRSNMERHIKQQHPDFWSQRPRGGHSTRGRPPTNHSLLAHPSIEQTTSQISQSYQNILPKIEQPTNSDAKPISEQVKYAILAQQLKTNKIEENDSEEELVIDEESQPRIENESSDKKNKSLLRGQLEAESEEIVVKEEETESSKEEKTTTEINKQMIKTEDDKMSDSEKPNDADDALDKEQHVCKTESSEEKNGKTDDSVTDLASVSELLDNASQQYQQFQPQYLSDEEGLVASHSDNDSDDDKSDSVYSIKSASSLKKKKKKKKRSAYSMAPNRVICPYCQRPFPWTSSLRRHILTHTGQKPYRCIYCSLLFTTKSNCDRHLLRKHKTNPSKGQIRNSSSPDTQTIVTNNAFSMRNVPERPYKCNMCPSSTFSTLGNLNKHRSTKHGSQAKSRPESPTSEPQNSGGSNPECLKQNHDQTDYDSQSSSTTDNVEPSSIAGSTKSNATTTNESSRSRRPSPRSSPGPSDVPFKCHLCDCGFPERQDCLEHIKINHKRSYEMLVAKGALDMDIDNAEDQQQLPPQQQTSDGEEKRGRFPDYSNRKVVCAFCLRRFWSAEDLRRHMRTHTGERPFSCDICHRRFTLKHSMLRHRKKHESVDSTMYVGTSGDEENSPNQSSIIAPRTQQQTPVLMSATVVNTPVHDQIALQGVASAATGDAGPSGVSRYHSYKKPATPTGTTVPSQDANPDGSETPTDNTENDLISNLLGIQDRNFIEKVLQSSPDDAAKLLGVKHNQE